MPEPQPFLFLGNHPCLNFINTQVVADEGVVDLIEDFPDLVRWLGEAGLLEPTQADEATRRWSGNPAAAKVLAEAKRFRATVRQMAEGLAQGKKVPQKTVDAINDLLSLLRGQWVIERTKDGFRRRFVLDPDDPLHLLGLVAEQAANLLCNAELSLVRKCENPKCILFFYDTSKAHARRWCSMAICGNRIKVAAHYHRHREEQS